ncbi:serine/threonine-protein kinase pim-2-like [Lycodopsis pacificus]
MEVAILLELNKTGGSVGMSAHVSLLDWYDLDQELILVLERPIPAKDLHDYIHANGGCLQEQEAKIILKQLVDAAIDLEEKKIFHRDIKTENILIETGSAVPRVRIIDFGVSCFVKRGATYRIFNGTPDVIPPEWFRFRRYRAGPTTVWQMGAVLFDILHRGAVFKIIDFFRDHVRISETLSERFLAKMFQQRPQTASYPGAAQNSPMAQ